MTQAGVAPFMSKAFTIRLTEPVIAQVKARARLAGMGWTAYLSRLVEQHVQTEPPLRVQDEVEPNPIQVVS